MPNQAREIGGIKRPKVDMISASERVKIVVAAKKLPG
jgi:hypothetical protein